MAGPHIKELIATAKLKGKVLPILRDKPTLHEFLLPYYEAFSHLNGRRQSSMAEQSLLTSEIRSYAPIEGFDADFDFYYRVITELDHEYMVHIAKQRKEEAEKKPTK